MSQVTISIQVPQVKSIGLIALANLAMVIVEIIFVAKYPEAEHACGHHIWGLVIFDLILRGIVVLACFQESVQEDPYNYTQAVISPLASGIWSMVAYYNISNECQSEFSNAYPQLWTLVFVNVILFYISLGLIVLRCLCNSRRERTTERQSVLPFFSNE
jgi:ABC-type transport system involved in cytochrome c biogenesis permease subunit